MSRLTREYQLYYAYGAITLLWPNFPDGSAYFIDITGLVPVRSSLLGESQLMSFPPATEIFQFTGFAFITYVFSYKYFVYISFFLIPLLAETIASVSQL